MDSQRTLPAGLSIFRYAVDNDLYLKNSEHYQLQSREQFDNYLVSIGLGERKSPTSCVTVSHPHVEFVFDNLSREGNLRLLAYRVTIDGHPLLQPRFT